MRRLMVSILVAYLTIGILPHLGHLGHAAAARDPAGIRAALAQVIAYLQTFDGSPPGPLPWNGADWDVTVHNNGMPAMTLEAMQAQHGADCAAPPATHPVSAYGDAVFQCRDHVMTAINASGYGVIYLAPDRQVDFSAGEASVTFDVSTARTSTRDWIDLWVTPFADHLQMPLDDFYPDLGGNPRTAVHLRLDNAVNNGSIFRGFVVRNFAASELNQTGAPAYETVLTPSATVRSTFELRLSRTHVKFGMPAYNLWWIDADVADLGWGSGVVQLGHHSYNPTKDGGGPNTWHWDNVGVSPAAPFTILHADRRYVDPTTPARVGFAGPAPAGAYLRFAGIGGSISVSYDGGATWQRAALQASEQGREGDEHADSYWTPIPAGASSVQFKGQNWWGGNWMARDISVWAPGGSAPSGPTATASPTPTGSAATSSPTPTVTRTSTPASAATPTPTLTASPGATATPTPTPTSTLVGAATPTPTPTSTLVGAATPTPTRTGTPGTAPVVLLGDQNVEANHDSLTPGTAEAFQSTAGASGTVNKLSVYIDASSTASQVVVGLYSNGSKNSPGTLLTQATISSPVSGAWNTVAVQPAGVTANRKYWVALLGPSGAGTVQFRDMASGGKNQTSRETTLTALPATWTPGTTYFNSPISAYAVEQR